MVDCPVFERIGGRRVEFSMLVTAIAYPRGTDRGLVSVRNALTTAAAQSDRGFGNGRRAP